MSNISRFNSRTAGLTCTGEEFYNFITDLRNFGQFIPAGSVSQWEADESSCTFSMTPMGEVMLKITSTTPFSAVSFSGVVLVTTEFVLQVSIAAGDAGRAEVKLMMESELNPMLKVMATGPIERFLEILVTEMENFKDWKR
jgi:hypothetical protein